MGNLFMAKGETVRADKFFLITVKLDPRHAGALNNLGVIAIGNRNPALAERFLMKSLSLEPDDARTWFLLAQVEDQLGHRTRARAAIEKALKINPARREFIGLQKQLRGEMNRSPAP